MSKRSNWAIIDVAAILLLLVGGMMAVACGGTSTGTTAQPTTTVTVTASATPNPLTSALESEAEKARESAVKEGVHSIQIGVQSWAIDHNDRYPKPSQVSQSGFANYVDIWPTNPYTNLPMTPGNGPGDFNYGVPPDRTQFKVVGYGTGAKVIITVP